MRHHEKSPVNSTLTGHEDLSALGQDQHRQISLFAEYAGMLLFVHAVFCALLRMLVISDETSVIVSALASLWIALRVVRIVSWHWLFPFITAGCLAALIAIESGPVKTGLAVIARGPFSSVAVLAMLVLVLSSDLLHIGINLQRCLQSSATRARLTMFLMRHGLRSLLWGSVGFVTAYSIAVPLVQEAIYQRTAGAEESKFALDRLTLFQNMLFKFSESMSGVWFFIIGACVGSFLNVVIYRVPAGLSVLAKASHCPGCQQAIRGRDNLPLVGWLKLQGRCRDCQIKISSRYPTVELTIGLMFLLLYFVELISGGTNLPGRAPDHYAGVLWILFYTKWDLVGLYVFHCCVMCALFSWAMIRRDGYRVPLKSVAITLAIVILAALLQPHLLSWTYNSEAMAAGQYSWEGAAITMSIGALAAVLLCVVSILMRRVFESPDRPQFASWLLIGTAFGWQAVVGIFLMLTAWTLLRTTSQLMSQSKTAVTHGDKPAIQPAWLLLPAAALVHHCVWRQLASCFDGWVTL